MSTNKQRDVLAKYGLRQRLGEIKSMLIARDGESQIEAASYLLKLLEDDVAKDAKNTTMADFILKEDTISFLCESMATTDFSLLEKLVAILHILSMSEEMAKQRDSLCVAEATLRAAHFLAPLTSGSDGSKAADRIHAEALRLLAVILRRWICVRGGRPVSEACRPEQLFSCVKNIYISTKSDVASGEDTGTKSCVPSPPIVQVAAADALAAIVAAIAEETSVPSAVNINFSDYKSLVLVTTLVLDGIQKLEGEDAFEVMCKLTEAAVKYSTLLFSKESDSKVQDTQDCKSFVFFKDVVDRFVANVIDKKKYLPYEKKKTLCVVSVFDVVMGVPISGPMRSMLAQLLASKGFLTILPEIMHLRDNSRRNHPRVIDQICGRRLLVSILTVLASDLLPESSFFEAQRLATAALALPNSVNDWGRMIAYKNPYSTEIRAFVLLWAYCLCLCCVGFQSVQMLILTVLPHLSSYLVAFPKPNLMGQACVKIIWLVFAVLSLCSVESNASKMDCRTETASARLVTILLSEKCLKSVYSHNPALLYWIFTTECPKLQRDVVTLWLEHEDSAIALGDLVRTKRDAAFRLLDVIQASSDVVTTRGATVLEMALTSAETAGNGDQSEEQKLCITERFHLAATIWSILPTVLSRSTQTKLAHLRSNVFLALAHRAAVAISGSDGDDCKDVLVAEKVFGGCEVRTACHLATLLASFTHYSSPPPVFQQNGLQLALLLLRFSQHRTDPRVFTMFAVHNALSKVLVSSIISENQQEPMIVLSSVQLLTQMLKCQKFFCIFPDAESAMIQADEILRLLENYGHLAAAIVEMLRAQLELRSKTEKPLLQLDNTNPSFWRALFLRLQMMCAKDISEMSLPAWTCMTILLTSDICDLATCRHLATQPWTHLLLRTVLSSGPSKLATVLQPQHADITVKTPPEEIVRFILAWLRASREPDHQFRTIPTPDLLTETFCVLANALCHWTCKNRRCNNNERKIAEELLSCGVILPPEVIDNVQKTLCLPQDDVN